MGKSKALFAGLCAVALVGTMGLAGCTQDNGSQNSSHGANSEQQNTEWCCKFSPPIPSLKPWPMPRPFIPSSIRT